jgi:hypothetical protein
VERTRLGKETEHEGDASHTEGGHGEKNQDRFFPACPIHHGTERDSQQRSGQRGTGRQQSHQQRLRDKVCFRIGTMGPNADTPANPPKKAMVDQIRASRGLDFA